MTNVMVDISKDFAKRMNWPNIIQQYIKEEEEEDLQQERVLYTILDWVAEDIIKTPEGKWKQKQALTILFFKHFGEHILQMIGNVTLKTIHRMFWLDLISSVHRVLVDVHQCNLSAIEEHQQQSYILLEYFLRHSGEKEQLALLATTQPTLANWIRGIIINISFDVPKLVGKKE